jgi:isopenicillin N synthase-like dioxygenase
MSSAVTTQLGIPIVDFAGVRAGDGEALRRAAGEINAACTSIGFFYIANHGVQQTAIDDAVAVAKRFFAQPVETKRRVAVNMRHRGFNALGDALMYGAKRPDYKEFFTFGLELPADDPDVLAGQPLRGPNNWPDFMPEMQPVFTRYYEAIGACGQALLRAVALGLGMPVDFFADKYRKRLQRTQFVYYPPQPPQLGDDQFGVAPHTDYGCITLLWQDDNGGLEVRTRDHRWIPAPPIDGTLVINVGDLLARWSNDRFASTPHRVINTSGRDRLSCATFYDPDFTAIVDPRDMNLPAGMAPLYPPVLAGEHIVGRLNQSMGYRKQAQ